MAPIIHAHIIHASVIHASTLVLMYTFMAKYL